MAGAKGDLWRHMRVAQTRNRDATTGVKETASGPVKRAGNIPRNRHEGGIKVVDTRQSLK